MYVDRDPDPPITPAQRHYLRAFEEFLRSGSKADRLKMRLRLEPVLDEAGLTVSEERAAA